MKFGSLFSGIGAIDLGLERAGMTCRWQVEIDEFANLVLEKHWPDVPRYRDVREVDGKKVEKVDLVCGGFPCTDISVAGRGAGLEGVQSGLWYEMFRIVREMRPNWVLIENVSALRTRGADAVLDGLEAQGYSCWPFVVGGREVGAPRLDDCDVRRGVRGAAGRRHRLDAAAQGKHALRHPRGQHDGRPGHRDGDGHEGRSLR